MPTLFPYHLHLSGGSGSGRSSRSKKRGKKSAVKEEPDQAYIDALSIAAANRLHVHSNGMSGSEALASLASPGSSASQQAVVDSWSGKLQYIGIRPATTTIGRPQARTWRVVVQKTKPPKKAPKPEVETERRKSLRSSTKRRKVDDEGPKDWRVVKEGEWECRLSQVVSLELEGLAGGLFDKHGRGEWRTTW